MVREFINISKLVIIAALCGSSVFVQARTVTEVVIENTGLSLEDSSPDTSEICRSFKPTIKQVKRFFSKVYPVETRMIMHDHYSPCYARGKVTFSDRSSGDWVIYSGGTASLTWSLGQDKVNLFYEPNQWHDPFAGMYGLEDD